jgi:hypothetical protein
MMSNLFVSIGSAHGSLCPTTLAPLGALGQVKPSGAEKHHMAVRPEEQAKTRHDRRHCGRSRALSSKAPASGLSFAAPHVWPIDSKERRESNSLGAKASQHNTNSRFDLAKSLADAKNLAESSPPSRTCTHYPLGNC